MKRAILFLAFCTGLTSLFATPAPDFTITTSDGVVRHLYKDFIDKQKLVVIQSFYTTSLPCIADAPYVQALYLSMQTAHPGQVEFVMLSTQSSDLNSMVAQFRADKGLTMLTAGADGNSVNAMQPYTSGQFGFFQSSPTFIVVAPVTGAVAYDIRGSSIIETISLLQQKIEATLPQECSIKTYSSELLDSVNMHIHTPTFDTTILASGYYSLAFIPKLANAPYLLSLRKQDDPLKGVSTFDLLKIAKHILGVQAFDGDWQFTAADVNCNGTVTTTDIVLIRKVILGLTDTVPCGIWHFVPANNTPTSNGSCSDFTAIKLGDVTGPYLNGAAEDRASLSLLGQSKRLSAGESYTITLQAGDRLDMEGLQLLLGFDPGAIRIDGVEGAGLPDLDASMFAIHPNGQIALSWMQPESFSVSANMPLLNITITAIRPVDVSDAIWVDRDARRSECYGQGDAIHPIALQWQQAAGADNRMQIFPNPAADKFTAAFFRTTSSSVGIQLIDGMGRPVQTIQMQAAAGWNTVQMTPESIAPGLYFLKIDGEDARTVLLTGRG
jgi:hypothetical protein